MDKTIIEALEKAVKESGVDPDLLHDALLDFIDPMVQVASESVAELQQWREMTNPQLETLDHLTKIYQDSNKLENVEEKISEMRAFQEHLAAFKEGE